MPQTATCKVSGEKFEILDKEIEFCKKMEVPLPTLSIQTDRKQSIAKNAIWKAVE